MPGSPPRLQSVPIVVLLERKAKMNEYAKYLVYRLPFLRRLMQPHFPYKINPGQLTAMIRFIDATRETEGAVIEIGVARGDTSVFLLEHMKTVGDHRPIFFLDTFKGFTKKSINYEVEKRNKSRASYNKFRYGDRKIFEKNLLNVGYSNFYVLQGDASKTDWGKIGPIGAVLLDIDLYKPTNEVLEQIWPRIVPGGGVVVDDCLPNSEWDGALQAYEEFLANHSMPFRRVAHKGGLIEKPL